jgi:heptosyltransferase-2
MARMYDAQRLVVFLPNPVGDVVMSTPVLRALREDRPEACILHVGRVPALSVLSGSVWADEMLSDRTGKRPKLGHWRELVSALRAFNADLAVLLPNSLRPAVAAWLGRASRIAGYARNGRGVLLTDKLAVPRAADGSRKPVPTIDYYRAILERLGIACPSRRMELPVRGEDARAADEMLSDAGHDTDRLTVMLNPGAAFGISKMWPAERYARLADVLVADRDAQVIINAAPSEKAVAREVAEAMAVPPLLSFHERDNTIGLLKGLVRRCDLLVTNDTGARHFGAAFGIAVVTLFGSTDPVWAQIDYPKERIVRVDVPCSPCQQKTCPKPPGDGFHACMQAISVSMVAEACDELLDGCDECRSV